MRYWAYRLAACVWLPKGAAALTASAAIWALVAAAGVAAELSYHAPASAPPVGYPTWSAPEGHEVAPLATPGPSQYWVMTPDHSSPPVPRPLNVFWRYGAPALGSFPNVRLPLVSV